MSVGPYIPAFGTAAPVTPVPLSGHARLTDPQETVLLTKLITLVNTLLAELRAHEADPNVHFSLTTATTAAHNDTSPRLLALAGGIIDQIQPQIDALRAGTTTVPGVPTITGITPSSGQVIVAYTDPANNGGDAITTHNVRLKVNGVLSSVPILADVASPATVTGLTNGTSYTVTATAINGIGESAESAPFGPFITGATVPQAPAVVSISPSGTQVDVFFSNAGTFFNPGNGGSPITTQTATATSSDGGTTRSTTVSAGFTQSPITVVNLTAGKHYTCTVHSTNVIGSSSESAASASFLVGSVVTTTAAKATIGMFTSEPNGDGVFFIKNNESLLGRSLRQIQANMGVTSDFAPDNIWGCCSDPNTASTINGNGSLCLGYDGTLRSRVQLLIDIPIAFGTPSQGGGNGFGLTSAQRITQLNFIAAGTTDGSKNSDAVYDYVAQQKRDRGINTTVASGSNTVNVTTYAGSGTLNVSSTAHDPNGDTRYVFPSTGTLFVKVTGGGVVKISYTGKTGTSFTGCTYLGRAGVGGGSGATTLATGAYVGSGTGWTKGVFRIGWEGDGDWFPWGSTASDNSSNQAALSAAFVGAYKHVCDRLRAIGWDSFYADFTGDPGWFNQRNGDVVQPLLAATTADGAAKYIQILGMDVYDQDQSNPFNSGTRTWQNPAAAWQKMLGYLNQHKAVAQAASVALGYGEWSGVSDIPGGGACGGDNPTFIQGMYDFFNTMSAGYGAGQLAYHTQFDSNNEGGNFSLKTNKPNALARFNSLFGP